MVDQHVYFPYQLTLENLSEFSWNVAGLPAADQLFFWAGTERFMSPTSLIMLAKICSCRNRKFPTERVAFYNLEALSYANNLGFSDALRLQNRPYPQGAFGGRNYIPMSSMTKRSLEKTAAERWVELGDVIQGKCEEIAPVVSQGLSSKIHAILAHSFREIFRNTFEHSGSATASYCAQYWPRRRIVEICIADRGQGVQKSLAENEQLGRLSSRDALMLSLMPGVSSKAWLARKKKSSQRGNWDNSGFGLFFAHRLFGKLGHFFLASGQDALLLRRGQRFRELRCNLEGTVVSLQLDLSDELEVERIVSQISKDAFKIKERFGARSLNAESVRTFLLQI